MSAQEENKRSGKAMSKKAGAGEQLEPANPALWMDADDRYFQAPLRLFWMGFVVVIISTLIVYGMAALAVSNQKAADELQIAEATEKAAEPPSQTVDRRSLVRRGARR